MERNICFRRRADLLSKKEFDMTYKMKTKKLIARWCFEANWHVSSIIMRSKLNLLTEPENKNKQAAWIILLLSVNSTFLVREIFLKSSGILYLKKNTRCNEGFKLPLFMLLCKFRPILPRSFFLRLLSAIFVPYFFSFAFVIMASTFFHDFF